jgi:single-stranded DNA-binding protein
MASDINTCSFSGNVVADPQSFEYGEGKKGARFRIACNLYGKNQDGSDKVAWLSFTAFNGLAENVVLKHVKKGTQVMLVASVETRPMAGLHDSEGKSVNRTDVSFVVRDLKLGGSGSGNGDAANEPSNPANAPKDEPPPF